MKEVFEKIIDRLKKECFLTDMTYDDDGYFDGGLEQAVYLEKAIEIVEQVEEEYVPDINVGNNGWIPCSSGKLPSDCTVHEVTVKYGNEMCYIDFAYYDEVRKEWWKHDDDGLLNVIAWKEHSEPYQPRICSDKECPYNKDTDCPAAAGCAGYEEPEWKNHLMNRFMNGE